MFDIFQNSKAMTAYIKVISNINKGFDDPNDQYIFEKQDVAETLRQFLSNIRSKFEINVDENVRMKWELIFLDEEGEEKRGIKLLNFQT